MLQFRAIDRRRRPEEIIKTFETNAAALKQRVYQKIAVEIVNNSPVDTGTYIMAHGVGVGRDRTAVANVSSKGKLRGRAKSEFAGAALANLMQQIAAIPPTARDVYFTNPSLHAPRVEYVGWPSPLFGHAGISGPGPYHVYARARAIAGQAIQDAARETGFSVR